MQWRLFIRKDEKGKRMIELGRKQVLKVLRMKDFGGYLGEEGSEKSILLPKKQLPEDCQVGDEIEVFVYKDSQDRWICTTNSPKICLGQLAVLEVAEVGKIGAFLNWGLEKDLLLPYKEQTIPVKKGDSCLVALYIDKSERLCATMKIYDYLSADSSYQVEDTVTGTVYRVNPEYGAFVAVDNRYYGMIPQKELYTKVRTGETVTAKVARVRQDGKLDLRLRERAYLQMDEDAALILEALRAYDGVLPFGEKADAQVIKEQLHISKSAFKRAIGRLMKEGKVKTGDTAIYLMEQ